MKHTPIFTNENLFNVDRLPESLIVLGGGPIGIELSQALSRLGVSIRVVELLDRILYREDEELVNLLGKMLTEEGVIISTGTKAVKLSGDGREVALVVETIKRKPM
jgi:pyruvate/2-oxoglutarate dehydrogenase complex dihydrolipoamide dehydrogenase (E3) component